MNAHKEMRPMNFPFLYKECENKTKFVNQKLSF